MKAYKFRLYLSAEQENIINNQLELCRVFYNSLLLQRIYAHMSKKKYVNYYYQHNELPELKDTFKEYKNIYSQSLQNVVKRVDKAFDNFFRRVKEKKSGKHQKVGFPRFKSKGRYKSLLTPVQALRYWTMAILNYQRSEKSGCSCTVIYTVK
ncbi:transposase [Ferroplasma sp.]|uniref:RNA-guided endonuclease InsQ/TnpB family protein n=1 Tax=Ferroplasma sp. TaxID=2591003 RepID=UPI00307EE7A3